MNVVTCESYERLSAQAAAIVVAQLERRHGLVLCAATGNSPIGLYGELARRAAVDRELFRSLKIIALDEWGGLGEADPGSAAGYLRERVLTPLAISPDRFIAFDASVEPAEACHRMRTALERVGPIDLAVLGLGRNGHVGFNEPGPALIPYCHVAPLSEETRAHAMTRAMREPPRHGLTLGMQEILAARRILLLVTGEGKQQTVARLLTEEVTTTLPASLLWLHGNVDCLIDRAVL
ncbi:MAG TPA: 6-phosphogluconolactonase [Gemmatimonadales bacterium]|nr:6-phosphogluconolactonase [Gemmatimonadales bacterium]